MTLTFNLMRAMVMTYSRAIVQGQRSVGSEDRVETNGRTDGQTDGRTEAIALPPSLMRSVINPPQMELKSVTLCDWRRQVDCGWAAVTWSRYWLWRCAGSWNRCSTPAVASSVTIYVRPTVSRSSDLPTTTTAPGSRPSLASTSRYITAAAVIRRIGHGCWKAICFLL